MSDKAISTESLSHESRAFPPSPEVVERALLNKKQFDALYERSILSRKNSGWNRRKRSTGPRNRRSRGNLNGTLPRE